MYSWFSSLNNILEALIGGLFTWFITILGASLVFFFKKVNNTILNLTLGFSAGIMLAASIFSLLIPAIEMSSNYNYIIVSIGLILGIVLILLCEKIYEIILKRKGKNIDNKRKRCMLLVSSISFHNIPEGLVIGVSFGSLMYNNSINLINAIIITLGIGIQNFPEGCAISLPLKREKLSTFKAFMYGVLSAITEPICAVIGAILVIKIKILLPYLLSMAAGAMLLVIISELIPESQNDKRKNLMSISTILGFIIMMILDIALG